jgi:uncharacterized protein YhfF
MADIVEIMQRYPGAETFYFGDSEELSDKLIALVRSGKKTATCEALRDFEEGKEAMPGLARCDIALQWDSDPALVLKTVSLELKRFCDVEEDFALAEGENETLEGWREDHQGYFERNGGFDPEMILVCERFELVEDLAG